MLYLNLKNFMKSLIKTFEISNTQNQARCCLEVFKISLNLSLDFVRPCYEGMCYKFIRAISESSIISKLEGYRYAENMEFNLVANTILEQIEKAQKQELEVDGLGQGIY
mmetsp:Transcript_16058/g.14028  ORF Transcript_16058/g.14028 Transcript_16058/m.14028 type:complete len:109 (+) Transcript_16058:87-413(+)